MHRIGSRLTYANVMVTILAFIVLGGGTALASIVVSSNGQIGPGTVSGHHPPSGDHANIINASVNGTDLANGAVGNAKLATAAATLNKLAANSVNGSRVVNGSLSGGDIGPGTITGSNLDASSVSQAVGLRSAKASAAPGDPPVTLFTHGPYTLSGHCVDDGAPWSHATIDLSSSNSDVSLLSPDGGGGSRFTGALPNPLVQTESWPNTLVHGLDFSVFDLMAPQSIQGHVTVAVDQDDSPNPVCVFAFNGSIQ